MNRNLKIAQRIGNAVIAVIVLMVILPTVLGYATLRGCTFETLKMFTVNLVSADAVSAGSDLVVSSAFERASTSERTAVLSVRIDNLDKRQDIVERKLDNLSFYSISTLIGMVLALMGIVWQNVVIRRNGNGSGKVAHATSGNG